MLVLSRREREAVLIGDEVVVTVTRVKGKTVRIAIDAPSHVALSRLDLPRNGDARKHAGRGRGRMVGV